MTPSRRLATWIESHYPYQEQLTHLKLQKLMFYCVGVGLAFEHDLGNVAFEPWEHGPVNREVWKCLNRFGAKPLPTHSELRAALHVTEGRTTYGDAADRMLTHVLEIYGSLSPWSIRCQTHLEAPWKEAYAGKKSVIEPSAIRDHFAKKYRRRPVSCPEWVLDPGSFRIDGLPVHGYPSIEKLAESVYRSATSS